MKECSANLESAGSRISIRRRRSASGPYLDKSIVTVYEKNSVSD